MSEISKTLITVGLLIVAIGVVVGVVGKIPGLGKLPGDFLIKRENFSFYFPLATCLLISLVLTVLFNLFGRK